MTKSLGNHPSNTSSHLRVAVADADFEAAERDATAGEVLLDLERRQDDVLMQLDELDKKLTSLLSGLGVTFVEENESEKHGIRLADLSDESESCNQEKLEAEDADDAYIQPVLRRKVA